MTDYRWRIALLVIFSTPVLMGQATPARTPTLKATAQPDAKFSFFTKSVDVFWGVTPPIQWPPTTPKYYLVEGVTVNGWRFRLACFGVLPHSAYEASAEEWELKEKQYRDVEWFRRTVLERVGWASLNSGRDRMTLYTSVASPSDAIKAHKPLEEVFVQCQVEKHIENGAEMSPLAVLSSQFRNWKDGTGYEVIAQTANESLTLGCTEARGAACMSIAPNNYRGTRSGSQMRLYDADLNLLGEYRIVSEAALPHE